MQSSYPGIHISFITDDNVDKKFINLLCHKPSHKLLLWNCQERASDKATTTRMTTTPATTQKTMENKPTTRNYSQEI
jgi:hypothetical protein